MGKIPKNGELHIKIHAVAKRLGPMLLTFAILGALAPLRTSAQTETTGAVAGTVRDQSGAVISGIAVKITLKTGGTVRVVLSNETGDYFAGLLSPGLYTVRADLKGFQTATLDPVAVLVTEGTTADITMRAGGSSETVLVTGAAPLIDASSAAKGEVIGEKSIKQLPLPTLNYQQLLALSPGTVRACPTTRNWEGATPTFRPTANA